jgi:hypothetical protein
MVLRAAKVLGIKWLITVEDLNIKGLSRGILAGPVHDAGWKGFWAQQSHGTGNVRCCLIVPQFFIPLPSSLDAITRQGITIGGTTRGYYEPMKPCVPILKEV